MGYGREHRSGIYPCPYSYGSINVPVEKELGISVFTRHTKDKKPVLSFEDKRFLNVVQEFCQNEQKSWVAPLPFRSPRPCLPNNHAQALSHLYSLYCILGKNPEMKAQKESPLPENIQQPLSTVTYTELCVFSYTSKWAIGAVAYLKVITTDDSVEMVLYSEEQS